MPGRIGTTNIITAPAGRITGGVSSPAQNVGRIATATPTPSYFYGTTDNQGGAIGRSDQLDASGKPYLGYRNPGDTSTTTDTTRIATTFDPRIATTTPRDQYKTPRSVPNAADLKTVMGGNKNTELDHSIPLELSGSNNKSNLRIEQGIPGQGFQTATDPVENQLSGNVAQGRLSLFDAQKQMAQQKGIPAPWTPGRIQAPTTNNDNSFFGILKNTITGLPQAALTIAEKVGEVGSNILPGVRAAADSFVNHTTDPYKKFITDTTKKYNDTFSTEGSFAQGQNGKIVLTDKGKERNAKVNEFVMGTIGEGVKNVGSDFFKFHPQDQTFLKEFADAVKAKEYISPKYMSEVKGVLEHYGHNAPTSKTKLADFITTASDSAEQKALNAEMNANLQKKQIAVPKVSTHVQNPVTGRLEGRITSKQGGFINPSEIAASAKPVLNDLTTNWYDRYDPINQMVKGKDLPAESNPYIAARMHAGVDGKVENRLSEYSDILKPAKQDLPVIDKYMQLEREIEKAGQGVTKFEGGRTLEQIQAEKSALETKLGPDGLARIQPTIDKIRQFDSARLQRLHEAGIISDASYESILKNNQKYTPFNRVDDLAEQGDNFPSGRDSFSVASQNVINKMEGSNKKIASPIESRIQSIQNTENLISRNNVARKVADLADHPDFQGIVIPLKGNIPSHLQEKMTELEIRKEALAQNPAANLSKYASKQGEYAGGLKEVTGTGKSRFGKQGDSIVTEHGFNDSESARNAYSDYVTEKQNILKEEVSLRQELKKYNTGEVPKGMEKISVFKNGIKEDYAVPKGVGEALKGMNKESVDLVTKWASLGTKALRAGATTLNAGFIIPNIIRDAQSAALVSKVGFTPTDWVKGFAEAINKGADYRAFLESGGGGAGYFSSQKTLPNTVKKLTESKTVRVLKTVLNPIELLRAVGETTELTPRLGVYKKSISKGLIGTEGAFNARNSTVDFSKMGTKMQIINRWVPFLNARLQGTGNMFNAIKSNPGSSALKLSAIVGLPVVATYLNNTKKHPEIWNDIADFEKRNNFIIIYGDARDEQGNPTQVVKIPKGDAKVFSNPLEDFIDRIYQKDHKSLGQLGIEMASDASPVSFEDNGKLSGRAVLSGVLPPTVKAGIEGVTNTNLYTGRDIVPQSMQSASPQEQYTDKTSPAAVAVGRLTGMSPMKIENAVGTQFGGLGRQVLHPTQYGSQITGRFSGAYGGQESQNTAAEATGVLQQQTDEKVNLKRDAQSQLNSLLTSKTAKQDFENILKSNPKLAKEIITLKEKKDLGFTSKDYVIDQLGVENGARAKFIVQQFNALKTKEEKAKLWEELTHKKLITKKVSEQINYLQNNH